MYRACVAMSSLSVTSSDTIEAHCPAAMPSEAAPSEMRSVFSSKKVALMMQRQKEIMFVLESVTQDMRVHCINRLCCCGVFIRTNRLSGKILRTFFFLVNHNQIK